MKSIILLLHCSTITLFYLLLPGPFILNAQLIDTLEYRHLIQKDERHYSHFKNGMNHFDALNNHSTNPVFKVDDDRYLNPRDNETFSSEKITIQDEVINTLFFPGAIITTNEIGEMRRFRYEYDLHGNFKLKLWEIWQNEQWVNIRRETYAYDSYGNMLIKLREVWQNAQWVNHIRETNTYDNQGNRLTNLSENWQENQWIIYGRSICTYSIDSLGKQKTEMVQLWQDENWINKWRTTTTYNNQEMILFYLVEDWNGQWSNSYRIKNTYQNQVYILEYFEQEWRDERWVNCWRITYTYDNHFNMLTKKQERSNKDTLVNYLHETYTFDNQDNQLTYLLENWLNEKWVNKRRESYSYNSQRKPLSVSYEEWAGEWVNPFRTKFTYDNQNNVLSVLYEYMDNNEWLNNRRTNYEYAFNGNLLTRINEIYENNIWIPENDFFQFKAIYYYDCAKFEVTWTSIVTNFNESLVYNNLSISPNPASDYIEITINDRGVNPSGYDIRIFDILGIEQSTPSVLRTATPQEGNLRIDVSSLSPGVYFVRIGVRVQKFVKY